MQDKIMDCKTKLSCSKCHLITTPNTSATEVLHQFAESLGEAIDAKDPFTSLHSGEVAEAAHILALFMGLSYAEADHIHIAGHLHDIGKIGVPDDILKKTGPLDDGEWAILKRHPDAGADILRPVAALLETGIVDMVRYHHERYDGNGYPARLKGKDIPLGARIISLADSLSAILQNRPYRPARSFEFAVSEIRKNSGSQFDPQVVDAFMDSLNEIRAVFSITDIFDERVA